jgi:DNA-binding GntR family transcriptional regulator
MNSEEQSIDFGDVEVDPIHRAGLRDQVTQRILNEVFERRLKTGERLVVQHLANRYEVSPTPVREALVELAGLGIVELQANRGAVVKPFGAEEIRHISQVRRVLELEACRCACGQILPQSLLSLRQELKRLRKMPHGAEWDRYSRAADSRLHLLIARYCQNPRLEHEIKRYLSLFRSVRNISHLRDSWQNYQRSNDVPQHLRIVNALIEQDKVRAMKALDSHLRSITRTLREVVFSDPPGKTTRIMDRCSQQ